MPSQKSIPISELITTANSELLRLDFKRSAFCNSKRFYRIQNSAQVYAQRSAQFQGLYIY